MAPKKAPTFALLDPRTKEVIMQGFAYLPEGMPERVYRDSFFFMADDLEKECPFDNDTVMQLVKVDGTFMAFVKVGMHQLDDGKEGPAWRLTFQEVDNLEVLAAIGIRGNA